jgi:hypothetical protein
MPCQPIKISSLALFIAGLVLVNQTPAKGKTNEVIDIASPTSRFVWHAENATYQGIADTNGLAFRLAVDNRNITGCSISISNQSNNRFYCWCYPNHYPATWLKVELTDTIGQPVEKTEMGKQFGEPINMPQLREMIHKRFQQWASGRARTTGFWPIVAGSGWFPLTNFNLCDLFKLNRAGEYTLHIRMPLVQRGGQDEVNPELKIIWLPEITAKIQIVTGDIQQSGTQHAN